MSYHGLRTPGERMWCRASICQWPRIQPAIWAGAAWITLRLVIA